MLRKPRSPTQSTCPTWPARSFRPKNNAKGGPPTSLSGEGTVDVDQTGMLKAPPRRGLQGLKCYRYSQTIMTRVSTAAMMVIGMDEVVV
jgi:hypothetical protein